ncbi:uncharacterized protein LOC118558278 [Fundulus heteroclitus]|uniref:uncharacterized protein LOC118558278 n=1 Tax=Fundulus heteroclitus TaxID=8078 RepID=UPI00165C9FA9|nr:uncharacterized protein LOC118558278 [Fundulus heteroclitus]XP_035984680.1 uncharacterized protein LOC118558278 [Fundulus heteroclitus]XP_035984681.1 uncharacterized protein LOC118558278 [Fundulus heteroclitus]XP_035984682.1 uncharacterized protein LOC118558278 [Fundulus heteroclitus]
MTGINGFGRGRGFTVFTPVPAVGRGRGTFLFSPETSTPKPEYGDSGQNVNNTFIAPQADVNGKLLSDIASKIGLSIGESIATCIETRLGNAVGSGVVGTAANESTMLNVIVRPDVKEPVSFKGDHDSCSVQEWEVLMLSYLKKKGIPVAEQAEEVLSKLVGRAREVVKVGIRSKPVLTLTDGPEPIFEILKQHFSDTVSSTLPLADFYATVPHADEHPFDYWLRLNKALELTEDCLRRQNKTFDYLSRDLAAMFIQNCPDPELSLIFKCKQLSEWTVADIHEKLVEHCRTRKQLAKHRLTSALLSQHQEVVDSVRSVAPVSAVRPSAAVVSSPDGQSAESSPDRLDRVIALLERVLEQQPRQHKLPYKSNVHTQRNLPMRSKPVVPCAVCSDEGHTTQYHCRSNHLCFNCFAPDHTRAECPGAVATKLRGAEPVRPQEN